MGEVQAIRKLAAWYRGWARNGTPDERNWRMRFAAFLDRKADDMERQTVGLG